MHIITNSVNLFVNYHRTMVICYVSAQVLFIEALPNLNPSNTKSGKILEARSVHSLEITSKHNFHIEQANLLVVEAKVLNT